MLSIRLIAAPAIAGAFLLTAGCEIEPQAVPPDATIVSQGSDDLTFTAPRDGTIYVYEKNSDRLLYSGKVEAGDVVHLDRQRQRLAIDNQTVFEKDLDGVGDHIIRFSPNDDPTKRTVILERHHIERN